jgi:AraC-like DNA-binding protein
MMSAPELAFRVAACTQLCLLALLLWRHRASNQSYRYAALLALSIACHLLAPPVMHEWQWGAAGYPVILLAIVVPAFFWYFASAVFEDGFRARLRDGGLLVATAVLGFMAFCASTGLGAICAANPLPVPVWLAQSAKLLWIAAAFATVLKDWQADLVEARRRLRLLILVVGGCYMIGIILTELVMVSRVSAAIELLNVSILLIAVTALCVHLLGINSANVFVRMSKPATEAVPLSATPRSPLAAQVSALMEEQRAYAVDPLSIVSLAARLRTQPYQLRQVINGELGYRNFNTFINSYRVREVAQRLAQAQYRNTPLLTLALDAGFRSLAPFNRSFKEQYGMTPSDYRQTLETRD